VNAVPIRLTDERWEHILDLHPELASLRETLLDAVENPDYILASRRGALGAVVVLGREPFLHVFYVEKSRHDGFILSAYLEEKMDKTRSYGAKRTKRNNHSQQRRTADGSERMLSSTPSSCSLPKSSETITLPLAI